MTEQEAYGQAYMNGMEKGKTMAINRILHELTKMEVNASPFEAAVIRKISEMIGEIGNE